MAPEQRSKPGTVDHRADIYALGVVLYQMLTGELPAAGDIQPPSRRVKIDVRLDEIVLRALEADLTRRYSAADQLKTEVETLAAPSPVSPSVATTAPARSVRRRWMIFALFVLVIVALPAMRHLSVSPSRGRNASPANPPIKNGAPITVTVQGAVARPAVYSLRNDATLLDAIAAAGGWISGGDQSAVLITLAGADRPEIHDLGAILHGEAVNPGLATGATVFVPNRNR